MYIQLIKLKTTITVLKTVINVKIQSHDRMMLIYILLSIQVNMQNNIEITRKGVERTANEIEDLWLPHFEVILGT